MEDEICAQEDCVDDKDMPTALEMMKNLATTGKDIVTSTLKGNPSLASEDERHRRWAICQGCPFLQNDRCTKCGCYMKVKVAFHATKCPEDKW